METRTIQKVHSVIPRPPVVGGRRCDWLNQRKIEEVVEKHDQNLRLIYAKHTNQFPQNKLQRQPVHRTASKRVPKKS